MAGILISVIVLVMWASLAYTIATRRMSNKRSSAALAISAEDRLHCSVDIVSDNGLTDAPDMFAINIRGRVFAPEDMYDADVQVTMSDVTDAQNDPMPILCSQQKLQMQDSPAFCYFAYYGKLPNKRSTLTYWTTVVEPSASILTFPRKGQRKLLFTVTILSHDTQETLAAAQKVITHNINTPGYVDIEEASHMTEALTIQLALAANQGDEDVFEETTRIIQCWITSQSNSYPSQQKKEVAHDRLTGLLNDALKMYKRKRLPTIIEICEQLALGSQNMERYAAMELVLHSIESSFTASADQTTLLTGMCDTLQLDRDKFRMMCHKTLPMKTRRNENLEFVLGITDDMDEETARKKLNEEYRMWNSRVNHPDTEIRNQADYMLELIATARNKYIAMPVTVAS